jgi:hypothetical protein
MFVLVVCAMFLSVVLKGVYVGSETCFCHPVVLERYRYRWANAEAEYGFVQNILGAQLLDNLGWGICLSRACLGPV